MNLLNMNLKLPGDLLLGTTGSTSTRNDSTTLVLTRNLHINHFVLSCLIGGRQPFMLWQPIMDVKQAVPVKYVFARPQLGGQDPVS